MAQAKLIDGVKHLHGALYLIPFDAIKLPDGEEGGKWSPTHNPRALTKKGRDMIDDPQRASQMRNSIRDKTLLSPLICRWVEEDEQMIPQLVGGRCRWDALSFLIKKKEMVKDPNSGAFDEKSGEFKYECKPANEVYGPDSEGIAVQIFAVATDLEALGMAYTENACREQLTEGHDIAVVLEMREFGATDEEILKVLDYQDKWLKDTTRMIEQLDERTLLAVIEGEVIREGAIGLSKIADVDLRHQVLDKAVLDAHEDHQKRMDRLKKKFSAARENHDLAEAKVVEAEFNKDPDKIESAKQDLAEADSAVDRTKKAAESAQPVVKNKNVRTGLKAVTGDEDAEKRCLREPKIKKFYLDALQAIVDNDGCVGEGEEEFDVDVDAVNMALDIVRGILEGERDVASILESHTLECDDDDGNTVAVAVSAVVEIDVDDDEDIDVDDDMLALADEELEDRIYPPGEDEYDDYD